VNNLCHVFHESLLSRPLEVTSHPLYKRSSDPCARLTLPNGGAVRNPFSQSVFCMGRMGHMDCRARSRPRERGSRSAIHIKPKLSYVEGYIRTVATDHFDIVDIAADVRLRRLEGGLRRRWALKSWTKQVFRVYAQAARATGDTGERILSA
jgi:hypothetical protein